MNENVIENKSFDFAVRIVNLHKHLSAEKEFNSIENDVVELIKILSSICKTSTK